MMVAALILYTAGFLLQLLGAVGVIQEALTSRSNMRVFRGELDEAEQEAERHRQLQKEIRDKPRDYGLDRIMEKLVDSVGEAAIDRISKAQAMQRRAVVKYVRAQDDISGRRRWTAVLLLVLGVVVGFVGNLVALYA
jgi:hypothetical protein